MDELLHTSSIPPLRMRTDLHGRDGLPVGVDLGPREVEGPGHRVHGAHRQLRHDLPDALPRHRDPPVLHTVVNREQLQRDGNGTVS